MAEEPQELQPSTPVPPVKKRAPRAPAGFYGVKVDSVGRVKLPAKMAEYLDQLEDPLVFVTEYDGQARIFFNGAYEAFLGQFEDPEAPELIDVVRDHCEIVGMDVEVDAQGRLTLPMGLRRDLHLENKTVYLRAMDDVITVYDEAQYKAKYNQVGQLAGLPLEMARRKSRRLG